MTDNVLRIPKTLMPVRLWVHPEGQVIGSLYLREGDTPGATEQPLDVLNQANPFLVVRRENPDEIRFYNRASVIRVDYETPAAAPAAGDTVLHCVVEMMDGSLVEGEIREVLPPEHSRLFDYLNQRDNHFIKLHTGEREVCLVNKSYIIHARADD